MNDHMQLIDANPAPPPRLRLLWEALVDCEPRQDLGAGPYGMRGIVPIVGGRFRGAPGFEALRGRVPDIDPDLPRAP